MSFCLALRSFYSIPAEKVQDRNSNAKKEKSQSLLNSQCWSSKIGKYDLRILVEARPLFCPLMKQTWDLNYEFTQNLVKRWIETASWFITKPFLSFYCKKLRSTPSVLPRICQLSKASILTVIKLDWHLSQKWRVQLLVLQNKTRLVLFRISKICK